MTETFPPPNLYQIHCARQRDRLMIAMAVRMARAALGWSQFELGRHLGMSQRAVHRIEQGHSKPRRATLLAIENLLGKAGLRIEDRGDGGFCIAVSASTLLEASNPLHVVAPSLVDSSFCSPYAEQGETAEATSTTARGPVNSK
jgi:transcriptional regulator with XRE-family HTH domain